ncbi:cysteine desulfurase family protein [Lacipirellula limnantheis]|uniref:cysteine desulfurase n=1 Tax=Lacipirellula limnantheis TaxID=2528024 RepID=A0A517U6Q5_9BACT|nr:cysteine desulfurase family protein [Lacipirellula limnantheis]QDT76318.1 Cysteine desulfurase [Lacipirellula limnantheis]
MPPAAIYLDHNATAPILPEVADAVRAAALRYPGNPASQHDAGRQARRALEQARIRIGEILGARTTGMDADQLIFTSGGTESNNLALRGLGQPPVPPGGRAPTHATSSLMHADPLAEPGTAIGAAARVIISAIEHPSISRAAESLALPIPARAGGFIPPVLQTLGVDAAGVIRLDQLESLITPTTPLASIMLASNETGVLQPVAEAAAICRRHGVLLHTDATQAVGKAPVDFTALGVDALTATAHKFHGPLGIGILLIRHGVQLAPALHGGFQQAALRPGTESVALAVGMQTALELWQREADARRERMTMLRERLEQTILAGWRDAVVIGGQSPRLPHTSNIALVGLNRQALVMALDLAGVACSSGSACASGSSEPSPTLLAMGLPEEQISSSVRLSLGATTTLAEIDEAVRRILNVCNNLRRVG